MQSGGPESAKPMTHRTQSLSSGDTRGKHRVHAELKRTEQEAKFLEVCTHFIIIVNITMLWSFACWQAGVIFLFVYFDCVVFSFVGLFALSYGGTFWFFYELRENVKWIGKCLALFFQLCFLI